MGTLNLEDMGFLSKNDTIKRFCTKHGAECIITSRTVRMASKWSDRDFTLSLFFLFINNAMHHKYSTTNEAMQYAELTVDDSLEGYYGEE